VYLYKLCYIFVNLCINIRYGIFGNSRFLHLNKVSYRFVYLCIYEVLVYLCIYIRFGIIIFVHLWICIFYLFEYIYIYLILN